MKSSPRQEALEESSKEVGKASKWRSLAIIVALFFLSLIVMGAVLSSFPEIDDDQRLFIKLPRNMEDAKNLGRLLSKYRESHYSAVMAAVFFTYIFLQAFAIPGSIFLSIMSGFLFSFPLALFLVCLCSSIGASLCFGLSSLVGVGLVQKHFPRRVSSWRKQIENHKDDLWSYMIFLRITPFLPNWFINVASPVLGIPLNIFFFGTFIGVAPPSVLFVHAGTTFYQLTTTGDIASTRSIIFLSISALVSIVPVLFKKVFPSLRGGVQLTPVTHLSFPMHVYSTNIQSSFIALVGVSRLTW
ncbi:transmembrane protein 41B-like [Oscarella lobularis]|uniref:transmembrane protein 41B-like n=1 Tax=Oscarella lobularis TaxID=121494 RepID=UPI0033136D4F